MTTLIPQEVTCIVCGETSEQMAIGSTNSFGACDLDTRPAPMARDNLGYEIQQCLKCHYCADDLSARKKNARKTVNSDEYRAILANERMRELACSYLAAALVEERAGKYDAAAWHAIRAAWACDDDAIENKKYKKLKILLEEEAARCRRRAIELIAKAEADGKPFVDDPVTAKTITIDLMRRAAMFKSAKHLIDELMVDEHEDPIGPILRLEWQLVQRGDTHIHTLDEVEAGE